MNAIFCPWRPCFNMIQFYNDVNQILLVSNQRQYIISYMKHIFYREIYKIDCLNKDYPHELLNLITETNFIEDEENHFIKLGLELQMQRMNKKNIFVGIKWLIFIHQIIRKANSIQLLEIANKFIELLTSPYCSQKIQEYIRNKLYNPYRQYLKKLTLKKMQRIEEVSSQLQLKFEMYGEYNFINYAISEFSLPIKQISPFLRSHYPYLNIYIELIVRDIEPIYKRVLHSFQENIINKLTFIEIQTMASKMLIFNPFKNDQKSIQATTVSSSSPSQNNIVQTVQSITPFFCLQNSNIGLSSQA